MSDTKQYDLVILGSGSTAFAAALRAQELGKNAIMIEERTPGGTCVNRGCLPSKHLIEAAKLVHDARHPRYRGLRPAEIAVDFEQLIAQKDEVVHGYRDRKYDSLLGGRFSIVEGHAEFVDPRTIAVADQRFSGSAFLIATGSRPLAPDIEGLDSVPYLTSDLLTSDESMELKTLPRSMLIVGAGYIALELGQMFQRLGTQVTVVERGQAILRNGYEPEVGPTMERILEEEGVRVVTNTVVRRVRRDGDKVVATVETAGVRRDLRAERLVIATGRRPSSDRIGLAKAGVFIANDGGIFVDEQLRTNVPGIFAAGDVIGAQLGNQLATPVGSQDGGIAAHNALSAEKARRVDHRVIPRTIFTDPQIAIVGMTEQQAVVAGHRCWCRAIPMALVPRAGAILDTRGFVKMVADADTNEVLGVTMVGANAGEIIHEAAMALRFRAKLHDFIDQLHVYPTMAEALKIAAISRFKDPSKLSCCAE